jgi:ubiquinone/menaquinone biosynthesis C-methylase UbiE
MEEKKEFKIPSTQQIKQKWDSFSTIYTSMARNFEGLGIHLANFIQFQKADVIYDMGCGGGNIAFQLCLSKKPTTRLVCSDLAPNMMRILSHRFDSLQDHLRRGQLLGVHQIPHCPMDIKSVEWTGHKRWEDLNVDAFEADNEDVSKVFSQGGEVDCLIANLSIHIVNSPEKMMSEMHRVLKTGGKTIFTVWGSQENSEFFMVSTRAQALFSPPPPGEKVRDHWYLNDRTMVIDLMKKQGFGDIRVWETFVPFLLDNNMIENWLNGDAEVLSNGDHDKKAKILKYFREEVHRITEKNMLPLGLNVLVFTGTKI